MYTIVIEIKITQTTLIEVQYNVNMSYACVHVDLQFLYDRVINACDLWLLLVHVYNAA